MATAFSSPPHAEDRTLLREISWETYLRINDENQSRSTKMAFFEGELEIMTVGWPHETEKERLGMVVNIVAEALGIDSEPAGQHTFRHHRKRIGFEADLSYYFTNLELVRSREKVSLDRDPPPDLVVEVDVSRNSERKLLMYAALGIREVWRLEGDTLRMYKLGGSTREYKPTPKSSLLRGVTSAMLTRLLAEGRGANRLAWYARIRAAVASTKLPR